ncbi:MAG: asparaginase [Parvibaculaceae bacterium]
MSNPVLVEALRGGAVESRHRCAYAVSDGEGRLVASAGDVARPVFPRSAIKAIQALPLIESGAADAFGFTDEEVALACASHNGEPEHVRVAGAMLAKIGLTEDALECGPHWPGDQRAARALAAKGERPRRIHNNCSGKHAGMLAVARHLSVDPKGYTGRGHPVQQAVERALGELTGVETAACPCGTDGCSVPTWAVPLKNLAHAFARLACGQRPAARRIFLAVAAHPFMVAGTDRFCTRLMEAVPRAFMKTGAEGVFCAAVPHAGLGLALKCDDGASRASEVAVAAVLARLQVWTEEERGKLDGFTRVTLSNWDGLEVGEVRAVREA